MGHFLTLSPEYCFVVVDDEEVVGFTVATKDSKEFHRNVSVAWLTEMREKYPQPDKNDNLSPAEV